MPKTFNLKIFVNYKPIVLKNSSKSQLIKQLNSSWVERFNVKIYDDNNSMHLKTQLVCNIKSSETIQILSIVNVFYRSSRELENIYADELKTKIKSGSLKIIIGIVEDALTNSLQKISMKNQNILQSQ